MSAAEAVPGGTGASGEGGAPAALIPLKPKHLGGGFHTLSTHPSLQPKQRAAAFSGRSGDQAPTRRGQRSGLQIKPRRSLEPSPVIGNGCWRRGLSRPPRQPTTPSIPHTHTRARAARSTSPYPPPLVSVATAKPEVTVKLVCR